MCDFFFFFQAEDGIRDLTVTGVQTCALPICIKRGDRPQVVDLLILETPICTIPDYKDSPNTDAFQGQDTVQVRRAESTWRDVGRLTGRRVIVTGTLSEWALGPDRTPVVIDPTEVRPALP